jgi:hypothetical protein
MELYRLGVKLFVAGQETPQLKDFVPVFHRWIQKQAIPDHLLVDVHDYSHIRGGPGILLVAHEGNISIDMDLGRPGLVYARKQPLSGTPENRLTATLKYALHGCRLLEDDHLLGAPLRFRGDEWLILANDRLQAPNAGPTMSAFEPIVSRVFERVLGRGEFKVTRVAPNSKERFAVRVESKTSRSVKELLEKILSSPH